MSKHGAMLAEIGAGKPHTEQAPTPTESLAGSPGVHCSAHERRNLGWPAHHRAANRREVGRAVGTQFDDRRRWQVPIHRVDDSAADGKRNVAKGSDPGRDVRFHVHGLGACPRMQSELFRGMRDRSIHAGNFRMH